MRPVRERSPEMAHFSTSARTKCSISLYLNLAHGHGDPAQAMFQIVDKLRLGCQTYLPPDVRSRSFFLVACKS